MNDSVTEPYAVDLRQYLSVLKGRKWAIIITAAVGLVAALVLSAQQTPLYRAEARLLVKDAPAANWYPNAEDEAQVVKSIQVADLVQRDLGLDQPARSLLGGVTADVINPETKTITVAYVSSNPVLARNAANSFARNYGVYKRSQLAAGIRAERDRLQRKVANLSVRLEGTIRGLQEARRNGDSAEVARLEGEKAQLSARLALLQQERDDTTSTVTLALGVGDVLEAATTPEAPFSPDHPRNGALGLFAGAILGVGLAFLRERLDDRFKGRPDVERAIESPVLATVPRFTGKRGSTELPSATDPRGPASEAYRNLRTGLQFIAQQRSARSFLITSPSAHEGKTSTVANLGVALSQTGRRTVLVSADLRRPQIEKVFGAESDVGLSSWLLGDEDALEAIVLEHPDLPNLSLLPAGPIPSNPAELLTSPRIAELISKLELAFDMVIFDSPPILPVADSVILASHVDGVVLIFDAASTRRSAAVHAKEQIERVGGHVVGCVLNAFDPSTTPYYYEPYYYSGYDKKEEDDRQAGSGDGLGLVEDSRSIR